MIIKIFQFRHVCIVFLSKAIYESPVIFWTFGLKLAYFFLCLLVMLGDELVHSFFVCFTTFYHVCSIMAVLLIIIHFSG